MFILYSVNIFLSFVVSKSSFKRAECYTKPLRSVFQTSPSYHVKERRNSGLYLGCNGMRFLLLFESRVPLQRDFELRTNHIFIVYLILL